MVEINTYYGKRYNSHTKLMKTVVIFCIPIIILSILANNGILPSNIYVFLTGIVIIIAVVLIGYQLIDISNRDNMNWDEYNWNFNQSTAPTATSQISDISPWSIPSLVCIGSECCYEGSTYDTNTNVCVPNPIYAKNNPANVSTPNTTNTTNTTNTPNATTNTPNATTNTQESFISGVLSKYAFSQPQPVVRLKGGNVVPSNA
jgi:hypothetical protein